jgi:exopolysaccharide biosynthesis polyprenyl glycosylphosphotransferase
MRTQPGRHSKTGQRLKPNLRARPGQFPDPVPRPEPVTRVAGDEAVEVVPQAQAQAQARAQARTTRQLRWKTQYTLTSVLIDLLAAIAAIGVAILLRFDGNAPAGYLSGSLALAVVWMGLVAMSRAYEHRFIGIGTEETGRVLRAGLALMAVVAFASFATKTDLARGYVIIAIPSLVLFSLLGRCAQRWWLFRERRHGRCVQRTVIVGSTASVHTTTHRLRQDSSHGMTVVAACVSDPNATFPAGVPVAGGLDEIVAVVEGTNADLVTVLPTALFTGYQLRRLAWELEPSGAGLVVCSGLTEVTGGRITIRPTSHAPMLQIERARLSGPSRLLKALFDRCAAFLGLALISPLMVAIAVRIWLHDGRNPFFRQNRVGINGREFGMWKFRTMVVNAEALKAQLALRNESDGPLFKMAADPRITPIGRTLRRYSLDELPQLFNVMLGQMSLVGPRPPLATEVNHYGPDMRRRLLVKPGITGLWQVSGRSDLSWVESEMLDIRYVENWSLGHDFQILWRTLRAVVTGSGAY